jgi:hypothetical protein
MSTKTVPYQLLNLLMLLEIIMKVGNSTKEGKVLFQADNQRRWIPRLFWRLIVCLPLGIMAYWFLRWFFLPSYKRTAAVEIQTPRSTGVPLPIQKDDFSTLKGIGPKTAEGLYDAAIYTFEQLGLMDLDSLEAILKERGLPSANASFWQQQATLAAAGDWEGLKKIQS